jgi:transcriptional regulator with XRE-family HTH domain
MDIGENVKAWRHQRGLSQWDLADKSGVGYATIARVELGLVDPRLSTLERLAEALDIDVVDFFTKPAKAKRPARKRAGR